MLDTKEMKEILAVSITVNGKTYIYEAHTPQRVAEIIASTVGILKEDDKLEAFAIH